MGEDPLNDIGSVDPELAVTVGSALEERKEPKGFGPRNRLPARNRTANRDKTSRGRGIEIEVHPDETSGDLAEVRLDPLRAASPVGTEFGDRGVENTGISRHAMRAFADIRRRDDVGEMGSGHETPKPQAWEFGTPLASVSDEVLGGRDSGERVGGERGARPETVERRVELATPVAGVRTDSGLEVGWARESVGRPDGS